jgi:hypothetical protein
VGSASAAQQGDDQYQAADGLDERLLRSSSLAVQPGPLSPVGYRERTKA